MRGLGLGLGFSLCAPSIHPHRACVLQEIERERASGVNTVTAAALDLEITGDDDAWASDVQRTAP